MSWMINVDRLSKKYRRGEVVTRNFREAITRKFRRGLSYLNPIRPGHSSQGAEPCDTEEFLALDDISFEVQQGEVVGVIGRNGAGKSTLLKVLSRITLPSGGTVRYRGRMAALLEVGTGFHGELTGRENIFLNGEILGMRHAEIKRKCDEIVAFAEVEKFLDTPVKFYSSGMYLRLAFAVAAHLEPEILIVDEVLAVGDAGFQRKCLGRMNQVAKEGRTILFVSHNMGAVSELCTRTILLERGKVIADGPVDQSIAEYSKRIRASQQEQASLTFTDDPELECSFLQVQLLNPSHSPSVSFDINDEIIIEIRYRISRRLEGLSISVTLNRNMVDVFCSWDIDDLKCEVPREPGMYVSRYKIPKMFLKAGFYAVTLTSGVPDRRFQYLPEVISFDVEATSMSTFRKGYRSDRPGSVVSPGVWTTERLSVERGRLAVT